MAGELAPAREVVRDAQGEVAGRVRLSHHSRSLRRRRLVTVEGAGFLVDLPTTLSVEDGDAFRLEDGRLVVVEAEAEALLEVRGDLPRLAWHIGNRHAPCEIGGDRLRVLADPVMARMLRGLGAEVAEVVAPFRPEGGAYGEGRVMGHDYGNGYGHSHDHEAGNLVGLGAAHEH